MKISQSDGYGHLPLLSAVLYWTRHQITKEIWEIDTKMHKDEKINDAVRKKPKKERKTNQK